MIESYKLNEKEFILHVMQYDTDTKKGIVYKIKNNINDMVYIGKSDNYKDRKYAHIQMLRTNNHHSKPLQEFVNEHGVGCLEFEIIIEFSSGYCGHIESYYIKKYNDKLLNGRKY